jgi:hypothetical protein
MLADTSSAPAASTPIVGAAATALASVIVEPIPARSAAAAVISSGAAMTNCISHVQQVARVPVAAEQICRRNPIAVKYN